MKRNILYLLLVMLLATSLTAAQDDEEPLRIAVLPVLNTLPLYVAEAEGFYDEQGVNVELVPFDSARDRQVALSVGEVDGANTDLAGVILLVNGGFDVKAVRLEPILEPYFSIVAGPESGIETIDDLRGVPIAISQNTIIEYLTTELLTEAGFSEDEIVYEEIPQIPVRLELLNIGQVAAATLPEPLTTLATELQGGTLIASDAAAEFVPTVLAFNGEVLEERGDEITAFLAAYEQAVLAINDSPDDYRDVMIENINIPEPLQETYPVPTFPEAVVPTEEETALVVDWAVERGLIDDPIGYENLVDGSFLPEAIEEIATDAPNLRDLILRGDDFEILYSALIAVDLAETLATEGTFTVFAPNSDAFIDFLEEMDMTVSEFVDQGDALRDMLLYHVVEGEVFLEDILELDGEALPTLLDGAEIEISVTAAGVRIDDRAGVVDTDVIAANGVIHEINAVLLPPEDD